MTGGAGSECPGEPCLALLGRQRVADHEREAETVGNWKPAVLVGEIEHRFARPIFQPHSVARVRELPLKPPRDDEPSAIAREEGRRIANHQRALPRIE